MPDTHDNHGPATVSTPPITTGTLVPQPHGGALRHGGTNRGGPGRPPQAVRARSLRVYDAVLGRLAKRLREDDVNPLPVSELVAAGSMAGRYAGLASETVHIDVALLPIEERKARIAQIVARAAARVQGPVRTVHGWHGVYETTEIEPNGEG